MTITVYGIENFFVQFPEKLFLKTAIKSKNRGVLLAIKTVPISRIDLRFLAEINDLELGG